MFGGGRLIGGWNSCGDVDAVTFNTDGQIYTSTDAGVTGTARESDRQWRGVASSADGMKLIAAELNGGQQPGRLWTSTDAGVTWTAGAFGGPNRWSVASSADGTKLFAAATGGFSTPRRTLA